MYIGQVLASEVLKLVSTPINVPVIAGQGASKHHRTTLRVSYITDEHAARKLLPEPLQLPEIPRAAIHVTEFYGMYGEIPITEVTQSIEAIDIEGQLGDFIVAVWTNSTSSLIANRDLYLQPVLFGDITLESSSGITSVSLKLNQTVALDLTAAYRHDPIPLADAMATAMRPKFYLKILGSPLLGEATRPTLFTLRPARVDLDEAFTAPSRMSFRSHVLAPLDDLPIVHIEHGQSSRGDWTPGLPKVMYRYAESM